MKPEHTPVNCVHGIKKDCSEIKNLLEELDVEVHEKRWFINIHNFKFE